MFYIRKYDRETGKLKEDYNIHNVDTRNEMLRHILAQNGAGEIVTNPSRGTVAIQYEKTVIFIQ